VEIHWMTDLVRRSHRVMAVLARSPGSREHDTVALLPAPSVTHARLATADIRTYLLHPRGHHPQTALWLIRVPRH
jgi:hypothetical protein